MLMSDDIKDVVNAFKVVLEQSQISLQELEPKSRPGLAENKSKKDEQLDSISSLVCETADKMREISDQCKKLQNIPDPIHKQVFDYYVEKDQQ